MDNELHLMNSYSAIPCDDFEDIQAQTIYPEDHAEYGMSSKILSLNMLT
jgi:hypothetical protein